MKKDEEVLSNNDHADTAALLEKVIVPAHDMLYECHGWGAGAGILSIGTFGLKGNFGTNDERSKEYLVLMPKDEDMQSEDEDEYSQSQVENDEEEEEEDDDNSSDGKDCEEEWNPLVHDKSGAPRPHAIIIDNNNLDGSKLLLQVQDYSISELDNNVYRTNKKEKERITLADLFSADSDDGLDPAKKPRDYCKTARGRLTSPRDRECCSKKTQSTTTLPTPDHAVKNGTLFPKKLIPRLKQDSRPIRKLNGVSHIQFNLLNFLFSLSNFWNFKELYSNARLACISAMLHLIIISLEIIVVVAHDTRALS